MIQVQAIAFMPAKRMPQQLAINVFLAAAVTRRHPLVDSTRQGIPLPLLAAAKLFARQVAIRAHDRAPEVASQVDGRFEFGRHRVVTVGDVKIEVAVVIHIKELAPPRPARFGHWKFRLP